MTKYLLDTKEQGRPINVKHDPMRHGQRRGGQKGAKLGDFNYVRTTSIYSSAKC